MPLLCCRTHYHGLLLLLSYCDVTNVTDCPQEAYISKVKALLGKELHLENGSHADGEQNGKTNGLSNGSHKDEEGEDVTMDVQEGEEAEEAVKSPTASKGKGGRKSKGSSDTKSMFTLQKIFII